jgi:hypothetical protein
MENFLHNNSLFVVLGVALIIWAGLAIYLFMIDSKITKIEKIYGDLSESNLNENKNI